MYVYVLALLKTSVCFPSSPFPTPSVIPAWRKKVTLPSSKAKKRKWVGRWGSSHPRIILSARLRHKHEWCGAAWSAGQAKAKWCQETEWGQGQGGCAQGTPLPSRMTEDAAHGSHPRPQGKPALRHPSCPQLPGIVWSQQFTFEILLLALGTRWGRAVGSFGKGEGELDNDPPAPVPLLSWVWLKSLCFSFSQFGFSHPRPSSNYRWDSPDWCERVFCQVSKIRLHHHPPRWHVSSFVGLHLLRIEATKRQMVQWAWNHVPPPCRLGGDPPGQISRENPPTSYIFFGMISDMEDN